MPLRRQVSDIEDGLHTSSSSSDVDVPVRTRKVLHFYGHCSFPNFRNRKEDTSKRDWSIVIHDYEEIETQTVNSSYRSPPRELEDADQREASEHTAVRLDRFSDAKDWSSYLQLMEIEVEDVKREACFHLYDVGRMGRVRAGRGGVPGRQLAKAVIKFLELRKARKVQNNAAEDATTGGTKDTPREMPKEIVKDTSSDMPKDSPKGVAKEDPENSPEDTPKPRPVVRNRRWNRIGKVASHSSQSKATQGEIVTKEPERLLPWAPKLLSRRVPRNLRNLPYLIVGSSPEEFGDAFVFPLSVPGTNHVLGCLAISRAWFESQGPGTGGILFERFGQMLSSVDFIDVVPVGKDVMKRDTEKPRPDADYWAKFSQDRMLRNGWGSSNAFEYQIGRFRQDDALESELTFLSLYTYGNTPLIYPDEQEGPVAKRGEYFDQFCCLNQEMPAQLFGDGVLRWLDPESRVTRRGLLGGPLNTFPSSPPCELSDFNNSQSEDLPGCVHDLLQTAQDYYLTLGQLCHNTQGTQKDFLEHIHHSLTYGDSRPAPEIKSLNEVLTMLKLGDEDIEMNITNEVAQWAQGWSSVEEVFLPEADDKESDDTNNAKNVDGSDDSNSDTMGYSYRQRLTTRVLENQPPKALAPEQHIWARELWTLIPHKSRIPYWCQQQIFNCVNLLLVHGIEKWLWPNGLPKADLGGAFHYEFYHRWSSEESWEPLSQVNDFCRDPSCPLDSKHTTKIDWRGFERVRAYALFQSGLCILNGFGTEQDVEQGLLTIRKAAEAGCRFARGSWHRLAKAYNRIDLVTNGHKSWIVTEALCSSPWALESFKESPLYRETYPGLRNAMLYEQILLQTQTHNLDDLLVGLEEGHPRIQPSESVLDQVTRDIQSGKMTSHENGRFLAPAILLNSALEDDPEKYHYHLIRGACCFGPSERLDRLLTDGFSFLNRANLGEFLALCLLRGDPDSTLLLLARGAKLNNYLDGLNPFFYLHNMPSERMHQLVKAFVDLEFDVNEKSAVSNIQFISLYPTLPDWPHERFKSPRSLYTLPLDSYITGESITPLRWAIIRDSAALVRALLDHGAEFPMVPERSASRENMPQAWPADICTAPILDQPTYNLEILETFLEKFGGKASLAPFAETPLGLITMEPDSHVRRLQFTNYDNRESLRRVLSLLRKHQPDDDARLFWAAVKNNHEDIVRELLDAGTDVELRFKGMTPLHTSVLHGRIGIFDLLLEHGADLKALTTERGISAMHLLFWMEQDPKTELAILEKIHNLLGGLHMSKSPFTQKVHPLHLAVLNSRVESVQRLVELGADVTPPLGEDIMPSLHGAAMTEWGVRELREVERTLPPSNNLRLHFTPMISVKGLTPIGIIVEREDMFLPEAAIKMLTILMNPPKGPSDISRFYVRPDLKQTILHLLPLTSLSEKTNIVEEVKVSGKPAGLDMNTPDIHGDTPLHYAYAFGGETPPWIWENYHDADESIKNVFGLTPLESRLWKFMDASCPEKERKVRAQVVTWGVSEREVPPEADSPLAQFWWELEKGLAVSQRWETKDRRMERNRGGVDVIRLDNGEWSREIDNWGKVPMTAMTVVP